MHLTDAPESGDRGGWWGWGTADVALTGAVKDTSDAATLAGYDDGNLRTTSN